MTRGLLLSLMLASGLCTMVPRMLMAQAEPGTMTQEEMIAAFKKQKTRSLVIAPGTEAAPAPAQTTEVAATRQNPLHTVPLEDQVNINVAFDFDSAALRDDQKPKLVALCGAITGSGVQNFRILGHTDSKGSDSYNERLSTLRAEEVKRYIVAECGIGADRMEAVGVGKRFPFDPADPRADVNRRVEFQVLG